MSQFPDHARLANLGLIEELYGQYVADPESVDPSWRHFFEGIDFGTYLYKKGAEPQKGGDKSTLRIANLIQSYRRYGHLMAKFNPLEEGKSKISELELENLGFFEAELEEVFPTLGFCGREEAKLKEIIASLKEIYASRIGFEFMDLSRHELEKWIEGEIEPELLIRPSAEEKHLLLDYLTKSEVLEAFLHTKYVGQTRFSLEGEESAIPLLAEVMDKGRELGIEQFVIGMAHRGRLNVLANILNKPLSTLFEEFEDDITLSFEGNDDVKYHMGFTGEFITRSGKKVKIEMAANPSHLESVDPVVLGQTYQKQLESGDTEKTKICPILIHGDASIAGQGVVYESLQFMNLPSYSTGGTLHIVFNNQIGYTTSPEEGRSTRYCTDIAKTFGAPVFHVNAEDPESCLFAAKLAIQIRQKFHCDVFIDLIGYRKFGHNEGDEPSFTQPLQYQKIRSKKTIWQIYLDQLEKEGKLEKQMAESNESQYRESLKNALSTAQQKIPAAAKKEIRFDTVKTAVEQAKLKSAIEAFCKIPDGFHLHPKLQKWLSNRYDSVAKEGNIDWSTGECLAFGTLLMEKVSIRLAGQDSERGTFSQRHVVWIDSENGKPYCSLCQIPGSRFEVVNSPLTEYAGMGFEYGISLAAVNSLDLWEAQYGDFNNGAQIIIDQYIVSAEQKWNTPSSFTLLLPHAYEGAGPEHSSARLERFLQLAANQNIQIVNASTPAQYFHLLRRQALRKTKKPLILFTPKGLLRSPACFSPLNQFTQGGFEEILDDPNPPKKKGEKAPILFGQDLL